MTAGVALALPSGALADCGGVVHARAAWHPKDRRAPLAIGDSVMLGAVPDLARAGFEVDARGCRQIGEAIHIIRRRIMAHSLPQVVVLAVGSNWTVSARELRSALRLVGRRRHLVLVTPRESGGGESQDAWAMRRVAREHPTRVLLLDWVRYSRGRGGWFSGDGLHLSVSGRRAFTRLLRSVRPRLAAARERSRAPRSARP